MTIIGGEGQKGNIPWNDDVVAVQRTVGGPLGDRAIVDRGPLSVVVDRIAAAGLELDMTFSISLHERRIAPFQYDRAQTLELVQIRRVLRLAKFS